MSEREIEAPEIEAMLDDYFGSNRVLECGEVIRRGLAVFLAQRIRERPKACGCRDGEICPACETDLCAEVDRQDVRVGSVVESGEEPEFTVDRRILARRKRKSVKDPGSASGHPPKETP